MATVDRQRAFVQDQLPAETMCPALWSWAQLVQAADRKAPSTAESTAGTAPCQDGAPGQGGGTPQTAPEQAEKDVDAFLYEIFWAGHTEPAEGFGPPLWKDLQQTKALFLRCLPGLELR